MTGIYIRRLPFIFQNISARAQTTDGIVVVQCVVVDDRAALLCVCEQRCVRKRCVRERVYCESRAEFG